ncbi:amino acid adenylation domain-containing protein [Kitasatospora sp. MAA4]|uniref:non-ribosomal peptide synthetase n=1 Tax=Kitasatospora sp. MAA4 TaxID=3035093 RepID=UPI002472EF5C|nr:amino acid adenylation domain-containing protein [Kitasatospora sp. MAA4]MDH6131465.1 amino acid adenylation domain-containing protein [Kitasatospora sp. MAA4]
MQQDFSPLSSAQQRLWFFWQLRPDGSEYNVPKATRLRGGLDAPALERSIAHLVARHAQLRATFPTVDGAPVLRIAPHATVPLTPVDLTDLPGAARERALAAEVDRAALAPFDLVNGPVFRARLIKLAADEHVLVLAFHHIVVDGWSLGIVERDLAAGYAAELAGTAQAPEKSTAAYDYRDYVADEQRMLAGSRRVEALAYWRDQLACAPPQLQLPTDWPHPQLPSHQGDTSSFLVSPQLGQQAQALATRTRVTRFVVLLSAYAALLSRLTATEEVVIGVPVSGRTTLEVEGVVGLFVNMLPLCVRVRPGMTFVELLHHVRDTFLAGYEYQDLPFQQVVEELQPERLTSRHPVFQSVFTYEDAAAGADSALAGLQTSPVPIRIETAKFELTLHLAWSAERVEGWMGFQSDLFDARTAELLGERYVRLLSAALAAPEETVARLPLLGAREERTVLSGGGEPPAPGAECVHLLVARRARERPTAVAVRCAEQELSYAELDRQAELIAARLRAAGARPGSLVATCLPRGADLVVAELAILKSGAGYLPLDPANPPSRLAAILTEAAPLLTLTDRRRSALVGAGALLTLEEVRADVAADSRTAAEQAGPGDLAYVIYTSGSTGTPKGVMVEHRSLANLVAWHRREFDLGPGDRTTLIAAPGFDASVWEIWPALSAGATLEVPDAETVLSPHDLTAWLVAREVTSCFVPTPLIERMAEAAWPDAGAPRTVLTGGDRLHGVGSRELPFRLVNNYGPTESTVVATSGTVRTDLAGRGALPDIGRPIPGVEVYVLDQELGPVPTGMPGELYLGGIALARGYLGRPELTADRFVPHPFSRTPGARLYRTGDLVRLRADGSLDFLGRNDHQLKIRGFRIEAGEIENVLRAHPGVRDAVVTATGTGTGTGTGTEPALAAYLVLADPAAAPDRDELHAHVGRRLPGYMRPHEYLLLLELPLTANGKVDRAALAEHAVPLAGRPAAERGAAAPWEREIAAVWARALGHDSFGPQDNFFDIGGHSLLLAAVRELLAQELAREVTILTLFEHPTVAALAQHLGATEAARATVATPDAPAADAAAARLKRGNARLRAMRTQNRGRTDS